MTTFIALLRGINVGGHRPLKMKNLREMFAEMEFKNVSTYIQSGNVIFDAEDKDPEFLGTRIKLQIKETFDYDVPVVIRSVSQLEKSLASFPFEEKDGWKGYISFLAAKPMPGQAEELETLSNEIEKFELQGSELFSLVDKQTDEKPQFSNSFVENKLGVPATTRNLRTVNKILELAKNS